MNRRPSWLSSKPLARSDGCAADLLGPEALIEAISANVTNSTLLQLFWMRRGSPCGVVVSLTTVT
jgi:hypothetical protein